MEITDFSKIRIGDDGRIHYFLYQQDGSKQPMSCPDTIHNRLFVSWCQKFDSPTTGHDVETVARRAQKGQASD
jgi:hypothetical protein